MNEERERGKYEIGIGVHRERASERENKPS